MYKQINCTDELIKCFNNKNELDINIEPLGKLGEGAYGKIYKTNNDDYIAKVINFSSEDIVDIKAFCNEGKIHKYLNYTKFKEYIPKIKGYFWVQKNNKQQVKFKSENDNTEIKYNTYQQINGIIIMERLGISMYDYYISLIKNAEKYPKNHEDFIFFINHIMKLLCNILEKLHENSVFHLDSHLNNFMLKGEVISESQDNIKIIDFGNSYIIQGKNTVLTSYIKKLISNHKTYECETSRKSGENNNFEDTLKIIDYVILFKSHMNIFEDDTNLIKELAKTTKNYIPKINEYSKEVIKEVYGKNNTEKIIKCLSD